MVQTQSQTPNESAPMEEEIREPGSPSHQLKWEVLNNTTKESTKLIKEEQLEEDLLNPRILAGLEPKNSIDGETPTQEEQEIVP